MNYIDLIDNGTYTDINNELVSLVNSTDPKSIDDIALFITHRSHDTYLKHELPRKASCALIQKGPDGVNKLYNLLPQVDGHIYPTSIISAIWYASQGNLNKLRFFDKSECTLYDTPTTNTINAAKDAFHNLFIDCSNDLDLLQKIIGALNQLSQMDTDGFNIAMAFFNTFTEASIKISKKSIDNFEILIAEHKNEETYQVFLKNNPVFLEPLATKIYDKQRLGDDLITDFVIQTLEDKYVLVEIEKPQDLIFTKQNDFSAKFTHAYGQVLDFLAWIDSNIAYAQTKLPNICLPSGLLVIGQSSALNPDQKKKLEYFNTLNTRIKVITYDEVLLNAQRLYKNIISSYN